VWRLKALNATMKGIISFHEREFFFRVLHSHVVFFVKKKKKKEREPNKKEIYVLYIP
jgi:hypothetical protein